MRKMHTIKRFLILLLAAYTLAGLAPVTALAKDAGSLKQAVTGESTEILANVALLDSPAATNVSTEAELKAIFADGGAAVVEADIALTSPLVVPAGKSVILDLNGKTIDRGLAESAATSNGNVITVNGSLILEDSLGTGKITGGRKSGDTGGGGVRVSMDGAFTMNGGNISGNTAERDGGGVFVFYGSFNMNGGTISHNSAEYGGGVSFVTFGRPDVFNMNAGEICGNTATNGGGIYVQNGFFNMTNGKVRSNQAEKGGGVFVLATDFTMQNSEISENSTWEALVCYGGGVYLADGTFTMQSGKINENSAVSGGGVYVSEGSFTMETGQINGNTTYGLENPLCDGGGVYVSKDSSFVMKGGEICWNAVNSWAMYSQGGGVLVYGGTFKVSGSVKILNNYRSGAPNNVYLKTNEHYGVSESIVQIEGLLTDAADTIGISTSNAPTEATSLTVAQGIGAYTISESDFGKFISDIGGTLTLTGNKIDLSEPPTSYLIFLSYHPNGGSGSQPSSAIVEGMPNNMTVASGDNFTRTNCSFVGWNTKADGSGTPYQPEEVLTLTQNTILYAQWIIDQVEVTVIAPQGGGAPSSSAVCSPSGVTSALAWRQGEAFLTGNFAYNTVYSMDITLTAGSGCKFSDTPEATVNGATAVSVQRNSDTQLVVSYTFSKTGPRSAPTAALAQTTINVGNSGGSQALALSVAGIAEGYNPVTWTMNKTEDSGNTLILPESTDGTLSNGVLSLGSVAVASNAAGQPAKSAKVTIAFGGNESSEYAGVPASITVTFRLAAGASPAAAIDYINEKITGVSSEMEYIVTDSADAPVDWTGAATVTGTEIPISGFIPAAGSAPKYIHICYKGIAGSPAKTIPIPARPDVSYYGANGWEVVETDTELGWVPQSFDYRINDGEDMIGSSEDHLLIPLEPGETLTFWKPATASSFKSAELTITAPARLSPPTVAIDFAEEKLNTTAATQYKLVSDDWEDCEADMTAADFGWDGTVAVSVQFVYPYTDDNYVSEAQNLTIPARPAAPEINDTCTAATITVTAEVGVQYRLGSGEWKTADANGKVVFTGLSAEQNYTITAQKAATASAFRSAAASTSVTTKPLADGTGGVSMAGWTYGDTAAEPVPVSATNGTGSVTYTYAGTKANGTTYNSSTRPTDAGSYTVTAVFAATSEYKQVISEATSFTIAKKEIDVQWRNLYHVYDAEEKSAIFSLADVEIEDDKQVSVLITDGQRINAGFQRVTASLSGGRAFNYTLTNPVGILTIQRAPVIFTVENNSISYDGAPKSATVSAMANGSSFAGFEVTYKKGGTVIPAPTDIGVYDIYAGITDANYRHVDAVDGSSRKIGVLTIFEQTPETYKTSFGPGEGSGFMSDLAEALAGTVRILPDCIFDAAPGGYVFLGWELDGKLYSAGASFTQPARDIIFTARWAALHSVDGIVTRNGTPVNGVVVTLMQGSQCIDETNTNAQGRYEFSDVPPGVYNLTCAKDGVMVTIKLEVLAADITGADITLPAGRANTVVEVLAGTPGIVVGNLEKMFELQDDVVFTNADQGTIDSGGTVEMRITAEVLVEDMGNTDQKMIADSSQGGSLGLYLEMRLNKSVTSGGDMVETPLTASNVLLEIVVPLPPELQGEDNYIVYRCHGSEVHALTATPNGNGEYITVNADKAAITIHAKLFSVYAVGYAAPVEPESPGYGGGAASAESYTITASAGDGGSISPSGAVSVAKGGSKTFAITANEDYMISELLVDGESVGAVSSYTFSDVTAAHTIKAVFVKAVELPYYLDANGNKVFLGFSADIGGAMKYIAPNSKKILFAQNPKSFTDIADHWAKVNIDFITQREIFRGTAAETFSPDTGMTRGMFAVVIGRLYERSYGMPAPSAPTAFTDISADAYYSSYVSWAAENGIIEGIGGSKFAPDRQITREEMASILYRFAEFLKVSGTDIAGTQLGYSDTSKISPWAIDAAKYCQQTGIITGRGSGNFAPKETATRAEAATILERFIEAVV